MYILRSPARQAIATSSHYRLTYKNGHAAYFRGKGNELKLACPVHHWEWISWE